MTQQQAPVKAQETGKTSRYLRSVKSEYKKVVWPTKQELINYTAVVLFVSALVSLTVYVLDIGIHKALSFILG